MKPCSPGQEAIVANVLACESTLLTEAQKTALTAAIADMGGMTTAQVLAALYGERSVVVPAGVQRRLTTWKETCDWMDEISGLITAKVISLSQQVAIAWQAEITGLKNYPGRDGKPFPPTYTYDPTTSEIFATFAQAAKDSGVLTQARIDEFTNRFLVDLPERGVNLPPIIETLVDANGQRLFPDGLVLEPADVEACRG